MLKQTCLGVRTSTFEQISPLVELAKLTLVEADAVSPCSGHVTSHVLVASST